MRQEKLPDSLLYRLVVGRSNVSVVARERFGYRARGVLIGGLLVLHLLVVLRQLANFALALTAQHLAHFFGYGKNDAILKVVTTHKEVGLFGRYAQLLELFAQGTVGLSAFGKLALQAVDLCVDALAESGKFVFGMVKVDLAQAHHFVEIDQRKLLELPIAIRPNAPNEEGPDGFGELQQECLEVENAAVVERSHDASILQGMV